MISVSQKYSLLGKGDYSQILLLNIKGWILPRIVCKCDPLNQNLFGKIFVSVITKFVCRK